MDELQVIDYWEREKIPETLRRFKKRKKFLFLDGPPYPTGQLHIGTALNKVIKDFYIRFFRMNNYYVNDQPGYDTHGVPIEIKVEQKFNFKNKKDILNFGIEKFVKECKKHATEFLNLMSHQFKNLGVWMDWESPYLTLNKEYIENAWFIFKKIFEKKLVYKGLYPVHVCPHCETVVSYNEIVHEKMEDPSIYVKFRLKDEDCSLIIWTTTPWTLPDNVAIMINPKAKYCKIRFRNEYLIVAKELLERLKEDLKSSFEVVEEFEGRELEGREYLHPLNEVLKLKEKYPEIYKVILSEEYVSLEEGTGLVHSAPAHGKEDFEVCKKYNLPIINSLNMDGTFKDIEFLKGKYVKDANILIIEKLREKDAILKEGKIVHEYPICWRCSKPLILQAIDQWFIKVKDFREKLKNENRKINWVPDFAKLRMENWIENLSDWPFSRQRFWGIPVPIWECEDCKNIKVVGSLSEINTDLEDLHINSVDKIELKCSCSGKMKRIKEIFDVWFDSGVAPWASLNYLKNKKFLNIDLEIEGSDQFRGWWNSQLIISCLIFNKKPFKNILTHGMILDSKGRKMSKSLGNIVFPEEVIDRYGRDVFRFFILSNIPWEDIKFEWESFENISKNINILKNFFNFVNLYVNKRPKKVKLEKFEDRWIISRLNKVLENSTNYIHQFSAYKALNEMFDFIINDVSRIYVKLVRDRVWYFYKGKDKKAALFCLYKIAETFNKMIAPFLPFISEINYLTFLKKLGRHKKASIHLFNWPKHDKSFIDEKLEEKMDFVKEVVESILSLRQKSKIKLRWPLRLALVQTEKTEFLDEVKDTIKILCNLKSLSIGYDSNLLSKDFKYGKVFLDTKIDDELKKEAFLRELIRFVQDLRKRNRFHVKEKILMQLDGDKDLIEKIKRKIKDVKIQVGCKKVLFKKVDFDIKERFNFEGKYLEIGIRKV